MSAAVAGGNSFVAKVSSFITEGDFYDPHHQAIWKAVISLYQESAPIDILSVYDRMQQLGSSYPVIMLVEATDMVWQHSIFSTTTGWNIEHYARRLKEISVERRSILASQGADYSLSDRRESTLNEALDSSIDTQVALRSELTNLSVPSGAESIKAAIGEVKRRKEQPSAVAFSHIAAVDDITGAFFPGDLILLAARPSMGKSDFGINIAWRNAKAGHNVLFLSLEMTLTDLWWRIMSLETKIFRSRFRLGHLDGREIELIEQHSPILQRLPLRLMAPKFPAIQDIDSIVAEEIARLQGKLKLAVIDYIGLIKPVKGKNREQEVAAISAGLKSITTRRKIPIIALSQMSRAAEQRDKQDYLPQLSDLRDSGALEQDADVVIMLYRESYYERRKAKKNAVTFVTDPRNDRLDAYILKNRQGATGVARDIHYDRATGIIGVKQESSIPILETKYDEPDNQGDDPDENLPF